MQVYGNGVTRNFLQILEADLQRAARAFAALVLLAAILGLVAYFVLNANLWLGFGTFVGALLTSFALGVAWARFVGLRRYEESIREHWNRWMRFSVSCVTVRECYAKVHGGTPHRWILAALSVTGLILAHLGLAVLALNESAGLAEQLPLVGLDAVLLGFFGGLRLLERLWYRNFLKSVNELLRDGTLNIWGVF